MYHRFLLNTESLITSGMKSTQSMTVIATTIHGLGAKFKPEFSAAWLAYICKTYLDGLVAEADCMGEGLLEIDD